MQTKRKKELSQGMNATKKLKSTYEKRSRSRSPAKKVQHDKVEMSSLRNHIENGNKRIIELKNEIEAMRRTVQGGVQGTVASEELA